MHKQPMLMWRAVRAMALLGAVVATMSPLGAHAADELTRPIRVSPDGHFLAQTDGKPFFYLGENVEYLFWRLNREDTDLYLRDRAAKGFTVIVGHVVPRLDMNIPNAYGERAFIGKDVSRPNPKYFAHIDWVIERAAKYGLRVGLAPLNGFEYVSDHIFNEGNVEAYGRWLGAHYRNNRGIVWLLGWDATPIWQDGSSFAKDRSIRLLDYRPVYDLMAKGLVEGAGGDLFITFHPVCCSFPGTAEPRTSLYLGDRSWLTMNMLQSSHFKDPSEFLKEGGFAFGWDSTFNYKPIKSEYDSTPTRPVIDGEPQYDNIPRNLDDKIASGRWDEVDIRNSAYHSVFAGAAGHDYNHLSVVSFFDPGKSGKSSDSDYHPVTFWKDALNALGAQQIGHVKALMLSRPYFTRVPDQSVIVGETYESSAHISGTRDRTGSYMMIYLPEGQSVTVDMIKLSGTSAIGWWFDPRTGAASRLEGSFPTNHQQRFRPPSSGLGNDWVLVLDEDSQHFGAPGTPST